VAGIRERPDPFFRLSPVQRLEARCFGVQRGETLGRVDVNYWRITPFINFRLKKPKYGAEPLGSLLTLVQYGSSSLAKSEPPGVPMLRMNNLQDEGWDLSDLKYIELGETELARYRLEPGDILFNRTNSKELVGKCAVFREAGDWVFASYLIRVRTKGDELHPDFASLFLNTAIGRLQIDQMSRQIIGMTNINAEEIRELRVPLPPPAKQAELVAAMNAAREQRRKKLAKADDLLEGMDGVLTNALRLNTPRIPDRNVFAVRLSEIRGNPVGPAYYAPQLQRLLQALRSSIFSVKALSDEVELNPGINLDDLVDDAPVSFVPMEAVADRASGEVFLRTRPLQEVRKGYTPFAEGDVLWAKITPCMQNGKSFVARSLTNGVGFGSTEFHVFRPKTNRVLADYVHAFLSQRSLRQAATLTFSGSAGQQRVPAEFLAKTPFPVPPLDLQKKIVAELRRRRHDARRLRTEAEAEWQAAKRWFEDQLLGGPPP
jgi:type I restriction enzyme, S subunit